MFDYTRGYEIDGSDTSYSILTSERGKCVEVVMYYLSLKTVEKHSPVEVRICREARRGMNKRDAEIVYIDHADLNYLAELLASPDILSCTISPRFHPTASLYPEIKRAMLDIAIPLDHQAKGRNLRNPVALSHMYDLDEINRIDLAFTPKGAEDVYDMSDDVSTQAYIARIRTGPYCAVEINCALGAPYGSVIYGLDKLAERFPELEIDTKAALKEMHDFYYLGDKTIYEHIVPETSDPAYTLGRMASDDDFDFIVGWRSGKQKKTRSDMMELVSLPDCMEKWEPGTYGVRDFDDREPLCPSSFRDTLKAAALRILKGVSGNKRIMTIEEYAAFARKLADASYFSDDRYAYYTTIWANFYKTDKNGKRNAYRLIIRFERTEGKPTLVIDIPCGVFDDVCREFGFAGICESR